MSTMTILTGSDRMNSVLWRSDTPQPVNYSPYGTSDADAPGGIGFNGERRDPVSGTTHLGNGYRSYSPALMRFPCPDSLSPFGAGGINPYAYCAGDPINHADPTGHMSTGQGVAMGLGILAGILLGIVTAGVALPVVLAADVAGGAVIGAGSELAAEGIDHQRINWCAVGISAGLGAAMALAGFGIGGGAAKAVNGDWRYKIFASRGYRHLLKVGRSEISAPKDLRLFNSDDYSFFESNRMDDLDPEYLSAQRALRTGKIKIKEVSNLNELEQFVKTHDDMHHKFVLSGDNKLIINSVHPEDSKLMSHHALATMGGINTPVKTAGTIHADIHGGFRVTNLSGHYLPTPDSLKHMECLLASWGSIPRLVGYTV